MDIKIISDLHLHESTESVLNTEPFDGVLVIAGDLFNIYTSPTHIRTVLEQLVKNHKHVVYVLGNHEYYSVTNSMSSIKGVFRSICHDLGIHLLNREEVVIEGIKFVGCTLWTDLNKSNPLSVNYASKRLNDFHYIHPTKDKVLSPKRYCITHETELNFLRRTDLNNAVVVTHHAPSHLSISEDYKGDQLNSCFYSDLGSFILDKKPLMWIHGHTHSESDYYIGDTRVLCKPTNPKGFTSTV